jgi:hypothetical protein
MTSQQRQKLRHLQVAAAYMPRGLAQEILRFSTRRQPTLTTANKVHLLLTGVVIVGTTIACLFYAPHSHSDVF